MKVYGTVSSAEDAPLLKQNKSASASQSSSNFKRIAAATLLAGGVFAVASKNTFAIGRNQVRLGDALDDAKAGAFYNNMLFFFFSLSLFFLLLGNKNGPLWDGDQEKKFSFLPVESFHAPWRWKKAPKRHSKRGATSDLSFDALRSNRFFRPRCLIRARKGNSIFGVSFGFVTPFWGV